MQLHLLHVLKWNCHILIIIVISDSGYVVKMARYVPREPRPRHKTLRTSRQISLVTVFSTSSLWWKYVFENVTPSWERSSTDDEDKGQCHSGWHLWQRRTSALLQFISIVSRIHRKHECSWQDPSGMGSVRMTWSRDGWCKTSRWVPTSFSFLSLILGKKLIFRK